MKKMLIYFITTFSLSALATGQNTIFSGSIDHNKTKLVMFRVFYYNEYELCDSLVWFKAPIVNGEFKFIITELRDRPAHCEFQTEKGIKELILFPGDSVYVKQLGDIFNYSGRGASKNNYWTKYFKEFSNIENWTEKISSIQLIENYIDDMFKKEFELKNLKLHLLDSINKIDTLESEYYAFEKKRINYEYFSNILKYRIITLTYLKFLDQ